MIDFVKINLFFINVKRLLSLPFLDFKGTYNVVTGEISAGEKAVAKYHYCTITIFSTGTVTFTGSIHKMYNSLKGILAPNQLKRLVRINALPTGTTAQQQTKADALSDSNNAYKGFNGNNFSLVQILEIRNYLELLFDCEPHQMYFQNLEFGYNLQMPFTSKLFLKGLLHHKGKIFDVRFGTSYQCKHQNIIIKVYDKAIQYGMDGNILRVEIRVCRATELLKLGIKSFENITATTLKKATELLKNKLDEVVYFDYTIDSKTFGTIDKRKYLQYQNPNFLLDKTTINRGRPQRELQSFIDNYSTNLKAQILKEVDNLFTLNTWFENKKCSLNTWFGNLEICYFRVKKCIKYSRFIYGNNQQIKNQKCSLNTISSTNVFRLQNTIEKDPAKPPSKQTKICLITGVNISMQKEDSFLLSHVGLKHLLKTDKKTFDEVVGKYIYPKYRSSNIDLQIKEVAHEIRCRNVRRKRKYNINQTSIF